MKLMIVLLTLSVFAAVSAIARAEALPTAKSIDAISASVNDLRTMSRVVRVDHVTTVQETGQRTMIGKRTAEAGHVHGDGSSHKEDEPSAANTSGSEPTSSKASSDDHKGKDGHDHSGHGHNGPKDKTKKSTSEPHGHSKNGHDHEKESGPKVGDDHAHEEKSGDGHGDEDHEESVALSLEQMREFGVQTAKIGPGPIATIISRPAEVKFNENFVAHVFPRVSGVVETVAITEGETIRKGQVIAQLDSRELAEAKAAYLAAWERYALAKENFEREETLQRKKITSAKSLSTSKTALAEARIALRASEQKLHALGLDKASVNQLSGSDDANLTRYTMRAPLGGTVIERHLVRGESVQTDTKAFTIADVSTIWVDISIYPRDLAIVRAGQIVLIKTDNDKEVTGKIEFVSPHVSETTRTAKARVVLDNIKPSLSPGQFVKAEIAISRKAASVRIPKSALQSQDGKPAVFVAESGKFEPRLVEVGQQDSTYAEVVSGLKVGETVVVDGAFVIKSQLSKESFGDGHNH